MFKFNLIEKLKLVFNFRKIDKNNIDYRRAGVIDEGKYSTYENCVGIGPDAGIINKGKCTKMINSKWIAIDKK